MNPEMNTEPETQLRETLQAAYPAADVPEALRQRVSALAAEAAAARIQNRRRRRRISLRLSFGAATALLILALVLMPRLSAVLALTRMANSLRDVRSVHSIEWQVLPDGKRVKTNEQWYQGGKWRVESAEGHSIQVCAGSKRWIYASSENTVTLEHEAFPIGYQGMTGFSITTSVQDMLAVGVLTNVQRLGSATIGGRSVHWIQITDNKYPDARSKIAVEDATDLPIQGEGEELIHGRWVLTSVGMSQYDLPIAASIFTPNFPKTARLIDVEAGRDIWRQRLAKGIASQTRGNDGFTISYVKVNGVNQARMTPLNGPRRVVVRDFQTNANGDVFLLFTNGTGVGSGNYVRSVDLIDEYGTKYIAPAEQTQRGSMDFIGTCPEQDPQHPSDTRINGYLFNNEQLIGYWWVPLQPHGLGKPHHFTLTMHEEFNDGNPVFQLPIEKPSCAVVPEYMPYMARPLGTTWVITHAEAMTRAYYYRTEKHDLPQALTWYQKSIAIDQEEDRRSQEHLSKEDEWFAIYQIQMELGRTEEAKAALLSANQDAVYASPTRDAIRAEMQKLGLNP